MPTVPQAPEPPSPRPPDQSPLQGVLQRSSSERLREYKYRFAQTAVFGLPAIVLAVWGPALGPGDHQRWSSLIQALLTGWILYINLGLLIEPILRRAISADLLIIIAAIALFVWSLLGVIFVLTTGRYWPEPALFWCFVVLLGAWNAIGWISKGRTQSTWQSVH